MDHVGLLSVGEILDGKYRIEALIGHGGMGSVYRATHLGLGAARAIKLIRSDMAQNSDIIRRFRNEALLAEGLRHPNLVALYDFTTLPNGTSYIVWEFVQGESLAAMVKRGHVFTPTEVGELVAQAADALSEAHRKRIVHRDISLDNLMITSGEDQKRTLKVLDFGIAKATGRDASQHTATGLFVGKVGYASPEQMGLLGEHAELDARTDVFSLAVVAYSLLTGKFPFKNSSVQTYVHELLISPERDVRERYEKDLPEEWRGAMSRALRRDRELRTPTIEILKDSLLEAARAAGSAGSAARPCAYSGPQPAPPLAARGSREGNSASSRATEQSTIVEQPTLLRKDVVAPVRARAKARHALLCFFLLFTVFAAGVIALRRQPLGKKDPRLETAPWGWDEGAVAKTEKTRFATSTPSPESPMVKLVPSLESPGAVPRMEPADRVPVLPAIDSPTAIKEPVKRPGTAFRVRADASSRTIAEPLSGRDTSTKTPQDGSASSHGGDTQKSSKEAFAPPPSMGTLLVTGTPKATVILDGTPVGQAPASFQVSPGLHHVVLTTGDGAHWEEHHNVSPGELITVSPKFATYGSLSVTSPFWVEVSLDQGKPEQTPVFLPQVTVGRHLLLITRSGYEEQTVPVTVEEGKTSTIHVRLEKKR